MRRARSLLPALFAAFALVVTGCGDDAAESGSGTATATATESTTAPESTTTAPTTTAPATTTAAPTTTAVAAPPAVPVPEASTLEGILGLDRPVVIGHAGGDQSWPHSTMFGFREAARTGTDVLEMDVQLTGDGVLVVQHDDTVDRTTETTGRVRDLTYDEIQALDSGYWWSDEWANQSLPEEEYIYRGVRTGAVDPPEGYTADDFRVETFRAVAEAFPDHVLDVEIKIPRGDDGEDDLDFAVEGARVLAEEIEELGRTDSIVVVSFNDELNAAFHDLAPDVATSPAFDEAEAWFLAGEALLPSHRILQIPPEWDDIDILRLDGFLEKAREENLGVWVWPNDASTQENPDFYEELLEFDIDGVLVGHPDQAVVRYRELGVIPSP